MKTQLLMGVMLLMYARSDCNYDTHINDNNIQQYENPNNLEQGDEQQAGLKETHDSEDEPTGLDYKSESDLMKWLDWYDKAELEVFQRENIAGWADQTNITAENSKELTDISVEATNWGEQRYKVATRFYENKQAFSDPVLLRMLQILIHEAPLSLGSEEKDRELEKLTGDLGKIFSKATVTYDNATYQMDPDLEDAFANSRDYDKLLYLWWGWRNATGPRSKPLYVKRVEMENEAARSYGFEDYQNYKRVGDYFVDDIKPMVLRLFEQVKPLYQQIHAYVRRKLIQEYPDRGISPTGPIPAHLLGNMWGQQWMNILPYVAPYPDVPLDDATPNMVKQGYTPEKMFRTAESFYTSLGLEPMTQKFWNYSMIERPADRNVVCHGSAWDMSTGDDFRIKMCTNVNTEDLTTIHHEMGHIEYYMQYRHQHVIFRSGANGAFHEAIGDTIALSMKTPGHLRIIGLLEENSSGNNETMYKKDINYLMRIALEKVCFLPFGLLMDLWRWDVYDGTINETNLNKKWWEYRLKYQGLAPPVPRSEEDFDPAAKYHIATGNSYVRYFLSFLGQFQFHKALCSVAGHEGPLHKCDIYESKEAGDKLMSMLRLGSSRPWQDAMEVMTGQREFDASAILEYFQPLTEWLQEQNKDETIGWTYEL